MARKRYAINSAKAKADVIALKNLHPPEIFQRRRLLRRGITLGLLNVLTVVLLGVSFSPFDCWYLAYVALVPWILALVPASSRRWPIVRAWLAGVIFWAVCVYWLSWITMPGYIAGVLYLSLYWLAAALILRAAIRRNMPIWLVLPVVWVALEYVRAYVIGFPWFYLAHTQYQQTQLIQIADTTGQYGVSFLVAMVNGVVVDLLILLLFVKKGRGTRPVRRSVVGVAVSCLAVVGLLGYGRWRLSQDTTSLGPVVGIVQRAFPIALGKPRATEEKILADHLDASRGFIGTGCGVVILPETMLRAGMNPEFYEFLIALEHAEDQKLKAEGQELKRSAEKIGALSQELGCPILAGGTTFFPDRRLGRWLPHNSVLLFDRTGRASARYDKRQLVPFSEYVPFGDSWPWLHRLLRRFVPDVMAQIQPGKLTKPFVVEQDGKTYHIACVICYEGTFARICRETVMQDGRKVPNVILANLSNDGWFILQWRNTWSRSTEQAQHLAHYYFRAVENRVPVVRAVNTGISGYIDSNGRLQAVVEQSGLRTMVRGTLLLDGGKGRRTGGIIDSGKRVLVDSRLTVYSQVGDLFAIVVSVVAVALAVGMRLRRRGRDEETAK